MEKENFDEELKSRIKQIFNDYNDGAADESWNRLREKYPDKNRRSYFFWWIELAAVLLLGVLIFWFLLLNVDHKNPILVKQQRKEAGFKLQQNDSVAKNNVFTKNPSLTKNLSSTKNLPITNPKSTATVGNKKTSVKTVLPIIAQRSSSTKAQKTGQAETKKEDFPKPETSVQTTPIFTGIKKASVADSITKKAEMAEAIIPSTFSTKNKQESIAGKTSNPIAIGSDLPQQQQSTIKEDIVNMPTFVDSSSKKQQQLIAKVKLATNNPTAKKSEATKPISKKSEKFSLGLYAGAHLNFAKGSNNQLGLGAGVSTNFRVAKNLEFSTGLGLLQNNLSYRQKIPTNSQAAANTYAATSAANATLPVVQNPNLESLDASLLALDIPLNLMYTFLPGKNNISVSAGLSSNTFAKEVYTYHYSTALATASPSTVNVASGSTQDIQSRVPSFSSFAFAKTLNLSAGFAYPLGKNKLLIEPFLKYPLGGMGSQKLLFGSAGINLKMKIQSLKK